MNDRPHRPGRLVGSLLAVVALLAGAACSSDDGGGSGDAATRTTEATSTPTTAAADEVPEPEQVGSADELYAAPDPVPAVAHGTLLKYQEVTPSPTDGATTYRVMYTSESVAGDPIVVTGMVVLPTGPSPEEGRTTLALAHGTTGIADECAPSRDGGGRELGLAGAAVERGWITTSTDYEGLGTPGRHPYLVGESEGRSVVDSVLAAGMLPGADQGDQLAIAGYSQGGHGALWAGEVAPDWAPDMEVVGTVAGAPATEVDVILQAAPRLPQAGFAYMIVAGIAAAYPEAAPDRILTPEGVRRLDAVDEGCTGEIFAAVAGVPASDLVRPDGPSTDPWPELAGQQNPGQVVTEAPVLIIHSEQDETVPVALSGILHRRMCEEGQVVERRVLPEGSHGGAAPEAYRQGLTWLFDLAAGGSPTDGCPAA